MRRNRLFLLILSACVPLLLLEIFHPSFTGISLRDTMIETILSRVIGAALFFFLIRSNGTDIFRLPANPHTLLCVLPPLAVSLNNAPIIGLSTGAAYLDADTADIVLFAGMSLAVGLFEELTFRGFLFPLVLQKYRNRSVFLPTILSSAVFAAVHLVNLFSGASPASVLLQVGYSFLIGGMCAIVLLKTRCIWLCVLLHSIYNFGGMLVPTLGGGIIWDSATVTITVILGLAVLLYMLAVLYRVTEEEIKKIC